LLTDDKLMKTLSKNYIILNKELYPIFIDLKINPYIHANIVK